MIANSNRIADIISAFPNLSEIAHEDPIDLDDFPLLRPYGAVEIVDSKTYLRINGAAVTNYIISTIPNDAFSFLYGKANDMRAFGFDYVTALKVSFALNSNDDFVAFYQPVYLKANGNITNGERWYDATKGLYYIFDNNLFRSATNAEKSMIDNYKSRIGILHLGDSAHQPFKSGDTEAVIFPFQEVFALMVDNANDIVQETTIYSSIRREVINTGDISIHHCMLLSMDFDSKLLNNFKEKYANRSNLCPPDCDSIKYTIAQ